jgi:hypothetical protein
VTDHVAELILANIATIIGGVLWFVRSFQALDGRLTHLEKWAEQHTADKAEAMQELNHRLERLESKIDTLTLRCLAFQQSKHTYAPPVPQRGYSEDELP